MAPKVSAFEDLESQRSEGTAKVGQDKPVPLHQRDDAPLGSTAESLLEYENGVPVRVAGPTHHIHLQNGRVVAHFGGGTHFVEPGPDGKDVTHKIIAAYDAS